MNRLKINALHWLYKPGFISKAHILCSLDDNNKTKKKEIFNFFLKQAELEIIQPIKDNKIKNLVHNFLSQFSFVRT